MEIMLTGMQAAALAREAAAAAPWWVNTMIDIVNAVVNGVILILTAYVIQIIRRLDKEAHDGGE
jgi:hypothetical protein